MHIPRLIRHSFLALAMLAIPAFSFGGVLISVRIGPPPLPVYVQPPCPGDGYIWTPGYWAYGSDGYYWVPGTWVVAPQPGLLWTPGYWGWSGGSYLWHAGYWGPHVGFYGGINYGFGYTGIGYSGGYWHGHDFFYNRSVNNVTITRVHIYNKTVINNVGVNRVSYNGGAGGINVRATHDEERWEHERHFEPTPMQVNHEHGARDNREFLAKVNHGHPAIAATARPAEFHQGFTPSRPEPRPVRNPAMSRNVPHPDNSAHNMNRPMSHDSYNNNHGGNGHPAPHSSPSHANNNGHENMPHNNVQHGEREKHDRR